MLAELFTISAQVPHDGFVVFDAFLAIRSGVQSVMKILIAIFLLVGSTVSAAAESRNCDDLLGWWQGDRFEYDVNETVHETSVFLADGRFYVQFDLDNGVSQRTQYEAGRWQCDGDQLILATTSVNNQPILNIAIYELLELNSAYIKVALESTDCSLVYGQCEGAVHEAIKIPEPEFVDGC